MNCNQIHELLPELATGMDAAPEVQKHIASCASCEVHLRDLQKTMALLDEWQAPEPSPYFDTRLQARLSQERREERRREMARPAAGWLSWMWRRPAWAMSLAAVVFAGALLVSNKSLLLTATIPTKPPSLGLPVESGTAVGDLQALEKNDELYADFDMLDELQVQDDVTANP